MTTLILSVFFSISASAYDVEVDGIYYNLIPNAKIAKVTQNGYGSYSGAVFIPEKITVKDVVYNVTSIGVDAFSDCKGLTSITIPNSVTNIGDGAFSGCSGLTSVTIPNSVTRIGASAFGGCSGLTSITIPNSVTSIGSGAFINCTGLTSITIPNSVTSTGDGTFSGCSRLTSITIPNSITSIGKSAFYNCSGLTSITIPNSITSIGSEAFYGCLSLTSITIPNSVTSIGDGTFFGCRRLTSITIPNSVTSIGDGTFSGCSGLTSITIPNSVTTIGREAFAKCGNLENVYCYAEKFSYIGGYIFKNSYIEYATLHVPSSAISYYKTTYPWSRFGTIKTLEGTGGETKKCETPTISFVDGKLTFSCATEGVEYVSEVTCSDVNKYYSNEINLAACYDITVTAMKTGYDNSDVATAKLYWLTSSGSLEGAGINNVSMRGIAIQSAGGFINISGLDNNETVSFYGIDGKALGSTRSIDGSVSFSAKQGSIVVAKIGKESVKIAVE